MLPFGSITSIIPLFILAFAYVIYFSASLLNRHNSPASGEIIPENKSEIRAELSSTSDQFPDFRYIDDYQVDEIPPSTLEKISFKDFTCSLIEEILYGNLTPQHRISGFSPRPPPAI